MAENKTNAGTWMDTIPPDQKVAIIVPLYGYWKDTKLQQFTVKTLTYLLSRLNTAKIKNYLIFVAQSKRVPNDVQHFLVSNFSAGNVLGADVENPNATYTDYLEEGIETAINETDAKFIMVANPWITIRDGVVDNILERLNRQDVAFASGFDLRTYGGSSYGQEGVPADQFEEYEFNPPRATAGFNWNFWATTRQVLQMLGRFDNEYKTHYFIERDMIQKLGQGGFIFEESQFFPIYSFDVDWHAIENENDFYADGQHFLDKWKFVPEVKY